MELDKIILETIRQFIKAMKDKSLLDYKFNNPIIIIGVKNPGVVNPPKITLNELSNRLNDLYNLVKMGFEKQEEFNKTIDSRLKKVEQNQQKDHELLIQTANKLDRVIELNNLKV